jgi:hypothetical protein
LLSTHPPIVSPVLAKKGESGATNVLVTHPPIPLQGSDGASIYTISRRETNTFIQLSFGYAGGPVEILVTKSRSCLFLVRRRPCQFIWTRSRNQHFYSTFLRVRRRPCRNFGNQVKKLFIFPSGTPKALSIYLDKIKKPTLYFNFPSGTPEALSKFW